MPYSRAEALQAQRNRRRNVKRRFQATLRDTWLLLKEFRFILLAFNIALLVCAVSFWLLWNATPEHDTIRFIDALYFVMTMLFFEPTIDFPDAWYLDVYFFALPLMGVIFLTLGVADFAVALFNRRSRQDAWEASVASMMNNHIIVIGLGHVGIRVVRELIVQNQDIVVIQRNESEEQIEEARSFEIPIIMGDGRSEETLRKANIENAGCVIICTGDDLANLQMANTIREMNDEVRIVMRMFDDRFASRLTEGLGIDAVISSSAMAAPVFAGAATGTEIMQTFKVADRVLAMGRIIVQAGTRLEGSSIRDVERSLEVSIVLLHTPQGHIDLEPHGDVILQAQDVLSVIAEIPALQVLSREWNNRNGNGEDEPRRGMLARRRRGT